MKAYICKDCQHEFQSNMEDPFCEKCHNDNVYETKKIRKEINEYK
jgi:Zn finger protein HypA/HybF involved in hydrogenase expression